MYFKIQPEQIQIHSFSSPSGDMRFEAGENTVYANLSRFLTGDFNITGSLAVNGATIPVPSASNYVSGDNSFVFGGISNSLIGVQNVAVNGDTCSIQGTGNAAINSRYATFPASSAYNTSLGGRGATFAANTTGASIIKDGQSSSVGSNGSHSLTISFASGVFVENGNLILKSSDLHVSSLNSGLFSGNLHVLGEAYKNGLVLATTGDLHYTSGVLSGRLSSTGASLSTRIDNTGAFAYAASGVLNTSIINTGSGLSVRVNNTGAFAYAASGALDTRIINTGSGLSTRIDGVSGAVVFKTGAQTISGEKTFHQSTIFSQSVYLMGNSGVLSGVSGATQIVPTSSGDSAGSRGLFAYSGTFLYYKISDNPHLWVRHSGQLNWP